MKIYFDDDVYVSLCDYLYEYKCPQRSEALDPPGAGVRSDCYPPEVGTVNKLWFSIRLVHSLDH